MTIATELQREYPKLDDGKKNVIGTIEGPVLVVAGPGSGKTFSLALRTLNLLLLEKPSPTKLSCAPLRRRRHSSFETVFRQ